MKTMAKASYYISALSYLFNQGKILKSNSTNGHTDYTKYKINDTYYLSPGRSAKYCDQRVSMSVCLSV